MTPRSGWEDILDQDEEILWQGRPDGAVRWKPRNFLTLIFGLFFAGFALLWMTMAAQAGGFFWMFGLIHFTVGLGVAVGPPFFNAFKRRHSWYTLTGNRAIIATDMPVMGRKLKSYPITGKTVLEYDNSTPATINFAKQVKRGKNGTYTVDIGFERVEDGVKVYRLMRDIQRGQE